MSAFVDNQTIEITLRYIIDSEGGITFLRPENTEECHELICVCRGRDFDTMSRILEDATIINHITGNAMVRTRNLYRSIMCNFVKEWNLKDDKTGKSILINAENVGRLHDEIPRYIAREWLRRTGRTIK